MSQESGSPAGSSPLVTHGSILTRELLAYRADVKGSIFSQVRQQFIQKQKAGFTIEELANRIGMDRDRLRECLRGDVDLTLETLSDLARGIDCRIDVSLAPLTQDGTSVIATTSQQPQASPETNQTS